MKNTIIIDIDTDRERPILFTKPAHIEPPKDKNEAREMVLNDIFCLAESLKMFIMMANENQYGDNKELVSKTIDIINEALNYDKSDFFEESKKEE